MIQGVIIGALKTGLKKAAKNIAGGKVASEGVKKVIYGKLTDTQAVILNRLKNYPNKVLFDFVSKDMGIPVSEIKELLKKFSQTKRMAEIAKSQGFKEVSKQYIRDKGIKGNDTIKKIIRRFKDENSKRAAVDRGFNKGANGAVFAALVDLENELVSKVQGIEGTKDGASKNTIYYDMNLTKYYNKDAEYSSEQAALIQAAADIMSQDLESYDQGTGGAVVVVKNDSGKWDIYEKTMINKLINDTKETVRRILGINLDEEEEMDNEY